MCVCVRSRNCDQECWKCWNTCRYVGTVSFELTGVGAGIGGVWGDDDDHDDDDDYHALIIAV